MPTRRRRAATALVALAWSILVAACSSTDPVATDATPPAPTTTPQVDVSVAGPGADAVSDVDVDAAAARATCELLRGHARELIADANDTVAGIAGRRPAERADVLDRGFATALERVGDHADELADLALPDAFDEADRLRAELVDGARRAADELRAERELLADQLGFAGRASIADSDVHGRVSQFFNAIEKALSVSEPAIGRYERRALQEAFLAEPACRHVVQPFRID